MEQTLVKPGSANENWRVVFVAWVVLVGVVYVATDFGLLGTVVGMAGPYFVYRGVRAVAVAGVQAGRTESHRVARGPRRSCGDRGDRQPRRRTGHGPDDGTESTIAEEYGLNQERLIETKREIATERKNGHETLPASTRSKYGLEVQGEIGARLLLRDIDGCIENLHLHNCTISENREHILSYRALNRIRNHVITAEEDGNTTDYEWIPGCEIDGSV